MQKTDAVFASQNLGFGKFEPSLVFCRDSKTGKNMVCRAWNLDAQKVFLGFRE